jgi:seryl-tRNA synthetase
VLGNVVSTSPALCTLCRCSFDSKCAHPENDQIESAWTIGDERKLDKVQQNVARLSARTKRLPGRWYLDEMLRKGQEETDKMLRKGQEETDKNFQGKVDQLDTKVEEKVTELKDQIEGLKDQIEGLKESVETNMDSILQALRQMQPEPEPEA